MIKLEGIFKVYDDGFEALKNINLEFKEGELVVLIGPSGCGKTTTMKLINRLINPSNGKVYIDGNDISTIDPVKLRKGIGYVIQHIGLFPHMTIAQNVGVVPKLLKWDRIRIDERVNELLNLVGLDADTYRGRHPSELSGGQQQRIGVIRALAAEPAIILMDEPFSALDPISREQLQDELVRLQEEIKKTIVFVTHDMDEALKIADRIVIMKDGEVIRNDTPEQILRRPANDFVKGFIGQKRLQEGDNIPTVEEVMIERPVTAYPSRGLAESIKLMKSKRVDSLIVVDKEKMIKGYVTINKVREHFEQETKTLADIMIPFEHVVHTGDLLPVALELMSKHELPYIPIVDENQQFIGLITRGSVVDFMADFYASQGVEV